MNNKLILLLLTLIMLNSVIAVNNIVYIDSYDGVANDAGTTSDGIVWTGTGETAQFVMDSYQDFLWCECIDYSYNGAFDPNHCNCLISGDKATCQAASSDFATNCATAPNGCYDSGAGTARDYLTTNRFHATPAIRYYTNCDSTPSIWQVVGDNDFFGIDAKLDWCDIDGQVNYDIWGRYATGSYVRMENNEICDSAPLETTCDGQHDMTVITSPYYDFDDDACRIVAGTTSNNRCDSSSECWHDTTCSKSQTYKYYFECPSDKNTNVDVDHDHYYTSCGGLGYNDWSSSTTDACSTYGETSNTICDSSDDNIYTYDDFNGGMETVCNLDWTISCANPADGQCHNDWPCNSDDKCSDCYDPGSVLVTDPTDCTTQYPYCTAYSSLGIRSSCFNAGGTPGQQECACCQQLGIEDTCLEGTSGSACEYQSECASNYYCDTSLGGSYECEAIKSGSDSCIENYECTSNDCDFSYQWLLEYQCDLPKFHKNYTVYRTEYNKTCDQYGVEDSITTIDGNCVADNDPGWVCDNDRTPVFEQDFNWNSDLICKADYNIGCSVNGDCVLDWPICNDYWGVCGECNTDGTEHDATYCTDSSLPYCTGLTPPSYCDSSNPFTCSCCDVPGIEDTCLAGTYNETCEFDGECIQGLFCNLPGEDAYITQVGLINVTPYYADKCQYDLYDGEQEFLILDNVRVEQCWSNKIFESDYAPPGGHGQTTNRTICGECYTGTDCIRENGILDSNFCFIDTGYPGSSTLYTYFGETGATDCECRNHTSGGLNPPGCDASGFCFGKEVIGSKVDCASECESGQAISIVDPEFDFQCIPYYGVTLSPKDLTIEDGIPIEFTPSIVYTPGYPPLYGCWYDTDTTEKWCYATNSAYCNPGCLNYTWYVNVAPDTPKTYELAGNQVITFKSGRDTYYDTDNSVNCWKYPGFWCGETCTDGILNRDETDVDYGGSCGTCNDGLISTLIGETSIDYGGVCGTCYDNQINIVYGLSVFGETEIDYDGLCGYCEDNITKSEDQDWILGRTLQNEDAIFDFEMCQTSNEVIGGAAFIFIIIIALGGLIMFIIVLIIIAMLVGAGAGLLGTTMGSGIKFLAVKGKERYKRYKEENDKQYKNDREV